MAHVASGIVSSYYEHGYGGPWDVCAGLVLVHEAGGVAKTASDGSEFVLTYGRGSICCGNAPSCGRRNEGRRYPKSEFYINKNPRVFKLLAGWKLDHDSFLRYVLMNYSAT
mmetsp:Transcript_35196/g.71254  ORF Transcript_35196/g.71254 Transcript_35196/m.71254 type:complete len:111 (-) Transcript_35196:2909-3241(-)